MGETGIRTLEQQVLAPFRPSFTKRYEQWKRGDLLRIALETLPKQVNKDKVLDNLIKLNCERMQILNLSEET